MPTQQTWDKIEHEWVTSGNDVSFRTLAIKYKVKQNTIKKRAQRHDWSMIREEYRHQAKQKKREVRQETLQEQIQAITEGTVEDYTLYEQLIALGLQDVTGRYTDPKDAQRDIKIHGATLLKAIADRRKLREWVHGEEKPVPDVVGKLDDQTKDLSDDERSSLLKSLANLTTEED